MSINNIIIVLDNRYSTKLIRVTLFCNDDERKYTIIDLKGPLHDCISIGIKNVKMYIIIYCINLISGTLFILHIKPII